MAFKFVPYAPEGSGGKDPVLAELTVTENGVYDNPTIECERSITWDCVVGDRATGTAGSGTIVKVSDEVFSAEELVGCTLSIVTDSGEKEELPIPEDGANDYSGVVMGAFFMLWSFPEAVTDHDIEGVMQVTVPEPGTYFPYSEGLAQSISLVFPTPISTPADGWNKVTVDVQPDPVLGELVVTENGVYDNPTIEGERSITWDGVIGDKTCVYMDGTTRTVGFVKVSDYVLSFDNFVAGTLATSDGQQHIMDENALMNIPDVGINCGALVVAVCDVDAFNTSDLAMGRTFTDEGTYFFFNPQMYISSFAFSDSVPADGWNKVTVNVAGDIVDVSELPTEVDEGKIYRVTNGDTVTYAIPNANPVKRLVDGAWVDLT